MWSDAEDPQSAISVKRLPTGESSAADTSAGETWEAVLPAPTSAPFVLLATRETHFEDDTPIALASIVDAQNQRGTVQVRSIARIPPEVRSRRRLNAIPIAVPPVDQYPTAIAAFRYNPSEQSALATDAPLVLSPAGVSPALPQAWIWRAELESRYGRDGSEHTLTCQLENAGLTRIRFQPPAGAHLRGAWVDGRNVADSGVGTNDAWRIGLPQGERFVQVVVSWTDDDALRRTLSKFTAPWPIPDVPILERNWTATSPPGTALADAENVGVEIDGISWVSAVFGPLARTDRASSGAENLTNSRSEQSDIAQKLGGTELSEPAALQRSQKKTGTSPFATAAGWTSYRFACLGDKESAIWIVDNPSMYAKAWALFAMMLAMRWWMGRRSFAVDLIVLGAMTSIALIIPARWTPLTSALWLGLCVGTAIVWLARPKNNRREVKQPGLKDPVSTARLVTATAGGCTLLLLTWQTYLRAAETPANVSASMAPTSPTIHVLVPVDESNRPSGGINYLPSSFYDELLQRTNAKHNEGPAWLFTAATYQAEFESSTAALGFSSSDWDCVYEVDTFVDRAIVRLPVGGNGAVLVPNGVELDGQAAPFQWDEHRARLEVSAGEAGKHRLVVKVHPLSDRSGLSFAVPTVAAAEVDLTLARSVSIGIASAIGAPIQLAEPTKPTQVNSNHEHIEVDLGPAARMIVRQSPGAAPTSSSPATFDVDELYWLRIRPGSVAVDMRWKLNVRSGRLQQLRVAADSRWRPLPPAEGSAVSQIHPAGNDPSIFVIELARPIVGRATVDASFLLVGASGIGHWQQPPFALRDTAATRKRYALTAETPIELEAPALKNDAIRAQQFASVWGGLESVPQIAWRASEQSSNFVFKTRMGEPKLSTRYQLSVVAGQKDIVLGLFAGVAVADGPVFEYRLRIPADLEIDSVSVRDGSTTRPAAWSRSQPDRVTVFLGSAAVSPRQLLLFGRVPTPPSGRFALPEFQVEHSAADGFSAIVLRRPEMRVEVVRNGGVVRLSGSEATAMAAQTDNLGEFGPAAALKQNLVAAFRSATGLSSISVKIAPNQPKLNLIQLTTMNRKADSWTATIDLDCQISDGLLDTMRFNLPPNWIGPFVVSPGIVASIDEVTGENRRQLVLRQKFRGARHKCQRVSACECPVL